MIRGKRDPYVRQTDLMAEKAEKVGEFVIELILSAIPGGWSSFIAELVAGSLVAPFIATVVTTIYYRLTAAHGGQPEPGAGPQSGAGYGPGYGPTGGSYGGGPYGGGYA